MSVHEFVAAIRGFHVYRQVWQPVQHEELTCTHEIGNHFDMFSIKTINNQGVLSGHLPREISRHTKFLLDRGASVTATLLDTDYRRSPLFQGGLEIRCRVKVELPATLLAKRLLERYKEMVNALYTEPEHPIVVGSFLGKALIQQPTPVSYNSATKKRKFQSQPPPTKGIRYYMLQASGKGNDTAISSGSKTDASRTKAKKKQKNVKSVKPIELSSDSESD